MSTLYVVMFQIVKYGELRSLAWFRWLLYFFLICRNSNLFTSFITNNGTGTKLKSMMDINLNHTNTTQNI